MSKQSNKVYAVRVGKSPGVYFTWAECEENVKGYSGAEYKSFKSEVDALAYFNGEYVGDKEVNIKHKFTTDAVAYVDGSYNKDTDEFSCGIVIILNGDVLDEISEKFYIPDMLSMKNIAGEIMGAVRAVQYCIKKGIKSVTVVHDYEGISKWCTGEWRTTKSGTQSYKRFYDEAINRINISFLKIKAHSGDAYNERADRLARQALRVK